MATKAGVEDLFGAQLREGDDGGFTAASRDVVLAGSVAALAPGVLRFFLARGDALIMRVFEKRGVDVGMAGAADVAADVIGSPGRRYKNG